MGLDEHETDAENRTSWNSASELTNPLKMVKKKCQALESLNYDVRVGLNEHETDAKNRTSTNSASELTKPLELVKKNMSGFGITQL